MTKEEQTGAENALVAKPMTAVSAAWSERVYSLAQCISEAGAGIDLPVEQTLHAGVYSRTVKHPKGVVVFGIKIPIDTQLIITGKVRIYCDGEAFTVEGHRVLKGLAGRQVIAVALEASYATVLFATKAKTIEEAEREFAGEDFDKLQNHRSDDGRNYCSGGDCRSGGQCGCVRVLEPQDEQGHEGGGADAD